jgi:hypothetical protein
MAGRGGAWARLTRSWRITRAVLITVGALIVALVELGHRQRHGHFFMPLTLHWDFETRDIPADGTKQRQYRARLTNWTLLSFPVERIRGELSLLWWGTAPSYRHRVERRQLASRAWTSILREDLGEERSRRAAEEDKVGFGSSISTSYYSVVARDLSDSLAGHALLRDGDQVRFVILSRLNGEDDAPGQRVFRSPAMVVRAAEPEVR